MINYRYLRIGDDVLVEDTTDAKQVWRGKPDGFAVEKVVQIQGQDDCIVLLSYHKHEGSWEYSNLVRIKFDGTIVWRAKLPSSQTGDWHTQDSYTNAYFTDKGLIGHSWSGYRITLDSDSGEIISAVFTK